MTLGVYNFVLQVDSFLIRILAIKACYNYTLLNGQYEDFFALIHGTYVRIIIL